MQRLNVPGQEWEAAKLYLKDQKDGRKMLYSYRQHSDGSYGVRNRFKSTQDMYETTHSFIKLNGKIYAIAPGKYQDAIAGEGAFGVAKYAEDKYGQIFILKIVAYESGDDHDRSKVIKEHKILDDLSLSVGYCIIPDHIDRRTKIQYIDGSSSEVDKGYILIKHLGTPLDTLIQNGLTDEQRLYYGIQLCWQVHKFHHGLASKSQTAYVHRDIKPDNITIDFFGRVHLIDFGLARKSPDKKVNNRHENPNIYKPHNYADISRKAFDVFALKRTLFMPRYVVFKGKNHETNLNNRLLSYDFLKAHQLYSSFNTDINSDGSESALELCALLIAAKYDLQFLYADISDNSFIAQTICECYFDSQVRFEKFIPVFNALSELKLKQLEFKIRKESAAEKTCGKLHNNLCREISGYFNLDQSKRDFNQFKTGCASHIEKSRKLLECHSGILGFLDAFLTCLASLVVAYPLTQLVIKPALNAHCLFFRTDSAKKLDKIENAISNIQP